MLKGYADEHVPFAIVQALRARGMDVATVQQRGREGAQDAELLAEALGDERVMLTSDSDFLALAAAHSARTQTFAPIFFWPQRRRRVGDVVRSILREASRWRYPAACDRVFYV